MPDYKFKVEQDRNWFDPEYIAARDKFLMSYTGPTFEWQSDPDCPQPKAKDRWTVSLPHQCDSWEITGEYRAGVDHDVAVAELEEFILQARAALVALRVRQEMGL
jgi:hypothetical protein